jgi:large repetitive protein
MMRGVCVAVFASLVAISAAAQSSSDMSASKTAPASTTVGSTIVFSVGITNNGPSAATNATFTDPLPSGVTFTSISQTTGPASSCSTPSVGSNGTVSCSVSSLAATTSASWDIFVTVSTGTAGTTLVNTVTASSNNADPDASNDSATTQTTVLANADLYVSKTAPATAVAGSNFTYSIDIGNLGPNDAASATLTDVLPADATFVSYTQTTGPTFTCSTPSVGSSGTVSCSVASLTAGTTAHFDIVVNVSAQAAGQTLINTASVSSETPDDNNENNTSTTGTNVAGGNSADVSILKTGPNSQPADTDITYTITVTNFGQGDATNVSWTDTLPNSIPPSSPLTFVSFTQNSGPAFNCGNPGATTTCTIATFPNGSTATFTLVAHIPSGVSSGHTYSNGANLTSDNDPNPDNDTSSTTVTVSSVDVGVMKSGPSTAVAGGPAYDYIVTLSNAGPDPADDASFSDSLPSGLTFVSVVQNTGPVASCSGGQLVACTISLLPNGNSAQFTITVQPQTTIPNGTVLSNTATSSTSSSDSNPNNNSSTVMTTVTNTADLSIFKSGPASAVAGNNITYTITLTNNGPSPAVNAAWTDTLPAGTTFVSELQTTGPTFTCTTGATISCSIATLASGASASFSVTAAIGGSVPNGTVLSNTATSSTSSVDPSSNNNSSTVMTTVSASADVSIVKSGPATAVNGTDVTYTVTVANAGPSTAANVTMIEGNPQNTTFVSETQNSGPTFTCSTVNGNTTCTIASLASGATAVFTIVIHLPSGAGTTSMGNTAGVSSTTPDPNSTNNQSTVTTIVSSQANLGVTKTAPAGANAGSNITYTIAVNNAGPSDAANVTLSDTLPAGTTFVSESQTTGPLFTCTTGATVTCTIASFAAGANATFNITVTLSGSIATGTTVTNTASVASTTPDPTPGNNSSSASTVVGVNADLSVTKNGPAATPSNTTITYTVTAANAGPSNAAAVTLTETVPAGMTFVSANQTTGPAFSCSGTGPVVCAIATFNAGASATFQFTFNVPQSIAPGTQVSDTATIASSTPDPASANNTASATTTVGQTIPALSPLAMALLLMGLAMIGWLTARR